MPNLSWGDAFATAAKIQPVELGDDFLSRTSSSSAITTSTSKEKQSGVFALTQSYMMKATHPEAPQAPPQTQPQTQPSAETSTKYLTPSMDTTAPSTGDGENTKSGEKKETNIDTKKKKKKKKKKKRDRDCFENATTDPTNPTSSSEPAVDDPTEHFDKPKKKQTKKGQQQRQQPQLQSQSQSQHVEKDEDNDDNNNDNNDDDDDGVDTEQVLEGRLINGDTIVLVDKSNGKVYSGLERDENGKHLHIGQIMDDNNEIQLFEQQTLQITSSETEPTAADDEKDESIQTNFPYPTDSDDHCETPMIAYKHITPLLEQISKIIGKKPSDLNIYDPYYCDGSVKNQLSSLGYPNVYNQKEDCYKIWQENKQPSFDVFLTNPPYSADHIDRLMKYIVNSKATATTPWLLLMPNWVHKKDYYIQALQTNNILPFYLVPKKRYVYEPPKHFREKKVSDTHKKSSPFISMWFIWGGTKQTTDALYNLCSTANKNKSKTGSSTIWNNNEWDVARSKSALRDLRRNGKSKKKR